MKKILCLLTITAALLAGCSSGNSSSSDSGVPFPGTPVDGASSSQVNPIEQQRAQSDDPENSAIGFISQLAFFDTAEDFLGSDLAKHLEQSGYKPYHVEFDESKYQLSSVFGDSNFYTYTLHDNATDTDFNYTFIFGSSRKELEQLSTSDKDTIEMAENAGGGYSVLVAYTEDSTVKYLTFMPSDGIEVRISFNGAEKDDLMKYANEITPVQ